MGLEAEVMNELKAAMKAKDHNRVAGLRAIKTEILKAKTAGEKQEITQEVELKLLQRMVKQRLDSMQIFRGQNRDDLADEEEQQAEIIAEFLPQQLSETEIESKVTEIIAKTGAESMKDMGKVMGIAAKEMAGKAANKQISVIVKRKLS